MAHCFVGRSLSFDTIRCINPDRETGFGNTPGDGDYNYSYDDYIERMENNNNKWNLSDYDYLLPMFLYYNEEHYNEHLCLRP